MALKLDKGKELLKKVIQGDLRHQDYDRVTKIAEKYTNYATASDVAKMLRQFTPRESQELFEQRCALTSLTTPDISNTLANPMYKVGRTTADSSITFKGKENEQSRKTLTEAADSFWGIASVDKYLTYRMPAMDVTDPNSFIVVEFAGSFDSKKPESETNKKVQPYPFEVNSKEAIHYEYKNNILQHLVVMNGEKEKYTMYLENESIVAIKFEAKDIASIMSANKDAEIWYKDEENKEGDVYYVLIYQHKAGMMPAKRVGTILDTETRQRTCIPVIHAADAYFQKAIKTVSEFDLTNALTVFPKIFRYGDPCLGDMAKGMICNKGMTPDDTKCTICKGTGWSTQTTTANEVIVKAPKDMKDMVSLELMMAHKSPPIDLIKFQKEYGLTEIKQFAIKAVFNGDTYVSDSVAQTATAKNIDLESVYDTLKPFADTWSDMWKHIMTLIAKYRDIQVESISHTFPKDFKMKSLTMLLSDLTLANSSGAPSFVKQSINHDIAKKMYVDRPDELLKLQTKEKFFPFNGKTEGEVNYILSNGLVSMFDKVFYSKFDAIFFEIEQEQTDKVNFYKMEYPKQKEIITKKVGEYTTIINEEAAVDRATAFGSVAPGVGVGGG